MKLVALVLAIMLACVGFAGALTFDKPHVAKNLTTPTAFGTGGITIVGEDSETIFLPDGTHYTGIDFQGPMGGVVNAGHGVGVWHYGTQFAHGEVGGTTENNGAAILIWYGQGMADYNDLWPAWNNQWAMHAHEYTVINGHMYDKDGNELFYKPGAVEGAEVGEQPASNPGLPDPNDQSGMYTTGDLTDQ